jgi:hypothetical protein
LMVPVHALGLQPNITPHFLHAAPAYNAAGELISSGADLGTGGALEYYHDLVYVAAAVQVVGCVTDWAWVAWLAVPAYILWAVWTNFLGPYFFSSSSSKGAGAAGGQVRESEVERKRREKKERQETRAQKFSYGGTGRK